MTKINWDDERFEHLDNRYRKITIYLFVMILLLILLWFIHNFEIEAIEEQMPKEVCEERNIVEKIIINNENQISIVTADFPIDQEITCESPVEINIYENIKIKKINNPVYGKICLITSKQKECHYE